MLVTYATISEAQDRDNLVHTSLLKDVRNHLPIACRVASSSKLASDLHNHKGAGLPSKRQESMCLNIDQITTIDIELLQNTVVPSPQLHMYHTLNAD